MFFAFLVVGALQKTVESFQLRESDLCPVKIRVISLLRIYFVK